MTQVIVDGQLIEFADSERLNGIQAARLAGVEIPHYCWHPGLSVVASCRMCLVETGSRNPATGEITMIPKLVPACQTPATNNAVFVTNSPKVIQSRAFVEECLLIDHPIDCPICDKAGECYLQDYHFQHGQKERRADIRPFTSARREMGETVTLFVDRCVMCTRCVRFTREITGTAELFVRDRGSHDEIDVFPGFPLDNKMSGNVVDLCPVGALGDKDFLYKQRVWFMQARPGVCSGCSTGCSILIEQNQDVVHRLKPRENQHINQWWMCDEGRYGYHHVHSPSRLTDLEVRDADTYRSMEWEDVFARLPQKLLSAGRLGALLSPHLTVEEAYLLARWIRRLDPEAVLAVGHVPVVGQDETFPNGFTIHAEKCPNRRGVEAIVEHEMGSLTTFEQFLERIDSGEIRGVWVSGGYHNEWIDAETAGRFASLDVLVVQDLFESPLGRIATHRLPAASFAEREGSYVNFAGRLQSFGWAIRPPRGVRSEGSVFWTLLERPGLYRARRVLDEVAAEIEFFSAAAGAVPETGVDLKAGQPEAAEPAV